MNEVRPKMEARQPAEQKNKNTAQENQAEAEKPKPPQPDFLTSVKDVKEWPVRHLKQPWMRRLYTMRKMIFILLLSLAAIIGIVGFFVFSPVTAKNRRAPMTSNPLERRAVLTTEAMDREIEASGKETLRLVLPKNKETGSSKKRNYATSIAAFIYKEEKERRSSDRPLRAKTAPVGLPSGTKIPALLSNRVFSFNVAAPVLAVISKDFLWQERTVIPKGSRFLGEASVLKSLDRINVSFDLLIFPDGRELRIRAMALSEDGSAGIKGKVEKHRDIKVLKAIGETLLGGATLFVGGGRRTDPFSLENQLQLNLAQNLTNQAAQDLRSVRVDTSVTAEAYTPIQVILLEAI